MTEFLSNGAPVSIPYCAQDDIITYASNGTMVYSEGANKCDPDASYSGTWSVSGDSTLTIIKSGSSGTFNILQLDANKLILAKNIPAAFVNFKYTYEH